MDRAVDCFWPGQPGSPRSGRRGSALRDAVCALVRGTDTAPDVWRPVRRVLPQRAALVAPGKTLGSPAKRRNSETQRTCRGFSRMNEDLLEEVTPDGRATRGRLSLRTKQHGTGGLFP